MHDYLLENSIMYKELVQEGETGWTFRPDQPEEVQRALDRALLTPAPMLTLMRETCRRTASQLSPLYGANQLLRAIRFAAGYLDDSQDLELWQSQDYRSQASH